MLAIMSRKKITMYACFDISTLLESPIHAPGQAIGFVDVVGGPSPLRGAVTS